MDVKRGRARAAMRSLAGLTATALADRAGIMRPTLRRIEDGHETTETILKSIALALNVSWIAYAEPQMPDVPVAS